MYAKARRGEIKDFTGISSPFEIAENPALHLKTENYTIEESGNELLNFVLTKIKIS